MNDNTTTRQTTAKFRETETFSVGDQVSYSIGSDVYLGTVLEVGPRKVIVQTDEEGALVEFTLKFPPKPVRRMLNIPERTGGHYTPQGCDYLDSRLKLAEGAGR